MKESKTTAAATKGKKTEIKTKETAKSATKDINEHKTSQTNTIEVQGKDITTSKQSEPKKPARTRKALIVEQSGHNIAQAGEVAASGMKKEYVPGKNICNVTFSLPKEATQGANTIAVTGDFNNWDVSANPMEQMPDGSFSTTIALEADRQYQFKYLIDDTRWENDWNADRYDPSPTGCGDNSVVIV